MILKVIFCAVLFALLSCVIGEFNLTVVHISDFHSHWFEFNENKHDCTQKESKEGKCYGGFPRLLTFVRNIRKQEKNVLVLSSGEFFLGRSLHAMHGWKPAHSLVPKLELDAMSLSNHDFDNGVFELSVFLYSMKFPVLCANMWARNTSYIYSRVNKSVVIDVNGTKVGIVGYIHRHALKKSMNAVSVKFLPEIPALQEEVSRLENEGVDKIIALGHAGYHTDLEIARKVKGVDIIIGGDSDIMLFDPGHDADESSKVGNIHGNYPRVHRQEPEIDSDPKLANKTLVLHVPQHGMYVGILRATFDDQGKIIHESGEPVLLDSSIPEDEDTLEFLKYGRGALETIVEHSRLPDNAEILGKTSGRLEGNRRTCRMSECSLGNFIVDAMLHEFTFHYRAKSENRHSSEQWGPIDALVFNSGPILRSIEPGYLTIQNILESVHLGGFIRRVYMPGQQVLDMMEHSVKHYDPSGVTAPGCFLQIAGLKVEYDLSQAPGRRVRSLSIRCRDCGGDNIYHPIKAYKTYIIGMPTFLRNGRYGFYNFYDLESPYDEDNGQFDTLLIVEYLRRMFLIDPKIDGRIKFYKPDSQSNISLNIPPLLFGERAASSNHVKNLLIAPTESPSSESSMDEVAQRPKSKVETINKYQNDEEYESPSEIENSINKEKRSLNRENEAKFPPKVMRKSEEVKEISQDDSILQEVSAFKEVDLSRNPGEIIPQENNDINESEKHSSFTLKSSITSDNSNAPIQYGDKEDSENLLENKEFWENQKSILQEAPDFRKVDLNKNPTEEIISREDNEADEFVKDLSFFLKSDKTNKKLNDPIQREEEEITGIILEIDEFWKKFWNSSNEKFLPALKNFSRTLIGKISDFKDDKIRRRLVADFMGNDKRKIGPIGMEEYASLIESYISNILINGLHSAKFESMRPMDLRSLVKKAIADNMKIDPKDQTEPKDIPDENEIELLVRTIVKTVFNEEYLKNI